MADAPTDEEALYTRALEIVLSKPSVAYLQRTLGVSYAKAGDLLERMLSDGLITGYSGRRESSPPVAEPPATPGPDASFDKWHQMEVLKAGASSGDHGTMALAAQLAGVPPCDACGYVKAHCRCAQPQPQPAQPLTGAAPLSDEQIKVVCRSMLVRPWGIGSRPETAMAFARLIEAAHGITAPSTPTPPEVAP